VLAKIAAHDLNGCEHEKLAQCTPAIREMAKTALDSDGSGYGWDDAASVGYAVVTKHSCGEWVLREWGRDVCPRCVKAQVEKSDEDVQALLGTVRELRRRLGVVKLDTAVDERTEKWLAEYPWPAKGY